MAHITEEQTHGIGRITINVVSSYGYYNVNGPTVTVRSVNDAPVAQDASVIVARNDSVRIDFASLISDVDGNALTLTFTNPSRGSLTRNTDGSYTYRPSYWYTGTDTIDYTVSDGSLTDSGRITINVVSSYNNYNCNGPTVTAQSNTSTGSGGLQYVLASGGQSGNTLQYVAAPGTTPVINWEGTTTTPIAGLEQQSWVQGFLGVRSTGEDDLASLTGLRVVV